MELIDSSAFSAESSHFVSTEVNFLKTCHYVRTWITYLDSKFSLKVKKIYIIWAIEVNLVSLNTAVGRRCLSCFHTMSSVSQPLSGQRLSPTVEKASNTFTVAAKHFYIYCLFIVSKVSIDISQHNTLKFITLTVTEGRSCSSAHALQVLLQLPGWVFETLLRFRWLWKCLFEVLQTLKLWSSVVRPWTEHRLLLLLCRSGATLCSSSSLWELAGASTWATTTRRSVLPPQWETPVLSPTLNIK